MVMDGCFSLKRFSGQSGTINSPILRDLYFNSTTESVDNSESVPDTCSDFRSGDSRKKVSSYCDISGIFGTVCKHGLIYVLADIVKGGSLALLVVVRFESQK